MNSSGIKRGLAVSAVSALAVIGLPTAAHAAPVGYSVTLSSGSAQAYQTVELTGVVKDSSGNTVAGEAVSVKLTQTTPDSVTANPFNIAGATSAPADATHTTWTATATATTDVAAATKGQYKIAVASSAAGTVAVQATDGGTANASLIVVGAGSSAENDAKGLAVAGTPVSVYKSAAPTVPDSAVFKLNTTDASSNGVFADGSYTVTAAGASAPVGPATPYTETAAFGADPYTKTLDLSAAMAALPAGSYTVKFWVDQTNHAVNTAGIDAGEPTATATVHVIDAPVADLYVGGKYDDGVAYYGTATDFDGVNDSTNNLLPADEAVTVPLSFQVRNDAASTTAGKDVFPAAGTKFAFDVTVNSKTKRIPATYDAATGLVTASYSVAKADAVVGDVSAELFLSQDAAVAGAGTSVSLDTTISTFAPRAAAIKQMPGAVSTVQATAGGSVSIPVVVNDQFGKASKGDVLKFTVSGGPSTTTPATDASGRTTITYTDSPAAAVNATETVTATDVTNSAVGPLAAVNVKYIAGTTAPAAIVEAAGAAAKPTDPEPTALDAAGVHKTSFIASATGSSANYDFVVVNAKNEALSNATVTLSAVGGFVAYNGKTGASLTAVTDVNGVVQNVRIGSKKVGKVGLTVTAGAASFSFAPVAVTTAGAAYSIVPVTGSVNIVPGTTQRFVFKVTDEWGNPVSGADVSFSTPSNTNAGLIDDSLTKDHSDANGNVLVVVTTSASEKGAGSLTVKPVGVWAPVAPASDGATATFADPAKGVTTNYTVGAVAPTPAPAPHAISASLKASSGRVRDILTVSAAAPNGTSVELFKSVKHHWVKVTAGTISAGKKVFRIKDTNGNKKSTTYKAVVHSSKTTKLDWTNKTSVK